MLVDELYFHRRRGLPRWERLGHPIDTASVLACYLLALVARPTPQALGVYVLLAVGSCLLVTKDELVHARHCTPTEHWLHAVLFILHPVVLGSVAALWLAQARTLIVVQTLLTFAFGCYQLIYWNTAWPRRSPVR